MIKLFGGYRSRPETKDIQKLKEFIVSSFVPLFYSVARDIEDEGGRPDFSTMTVIFHKPEDFEGTPAMSEERQNTLGVKMYGEFGGET